MKKPALVILAAGMGSRYGGLKQMDPMDPMGHAIIDYSIYDAKRAGFGKVVFVIKKAIEKDFKETIGARVPEGMEVCYAYQEVDALPKGYNVPEGRVKPWGTAHAVLCAKPFINEPFAVINADDYYYKPRRGRRKSTICNGGISSWKYCDREWLCIKRCL